MPIFPIRSPSRTHAYSLLPTSSSASSPDHTPTTKPMRPTTRWGAIFSSRRYARICVAGIFVLAFFLLFMPVESPHAFSASSVDSSYPPYPIPIDDYPSFDSLPPTYGRFVEYEENLPQNNESLPYPEGKHAKYLYFANHNWGAGWGNSMQDLILNAHLAYTSGRSSVIYNYTWSRDTSDTTLYNGKHLIPSRIPISALVSGPLAGQPFSNPEVAAEHPRFVSQHYYNQVCPDPLIIHGDDIRETLPHDSSAQQTMDAWVKKLRSIDDRCVEIKKDTAAPFDIWILGSPRLHDIVPSLIASPIVKEFSWSPLIHYAFQVNKHHFTSASSQPQTKQSFFSYLFSWAFSSDTEASRKNDYSLSSTDPHPPTLPILALHLRRGDFEEHCEHLFKWKSTYTGFNSLPELPDRFFAENREAFDTMSDDEARDIYFSKCLVDAEAVRKRVVRAVAEWREKELEIEREKMRFGAEQRVKQKLRKVYIMTNGDREWLEELKGLLHGDAARSGQTAKEDKHDGSEFDYGFVWDWEEIATSRDLQLGWEAKYVAQAADMYVGQRAEVFVGNGFSSLTANIVLLRKMNGIESWKTRFW